MSDLPIHNAADHTDGVISLDKFATFIFIKKDLINQTMHLVASALVAQNGPEYIMI